MRETRFRGTVARLPSHPITEAYYYLYFRHRSSDRLIGQGHTAANCSFSTSSLSSRACILCTTVCWLPSTSLLCREVSSFPLKCNLIVNTFLQSSFSLPHFLFLPHSPKRESLRKYILSLSPLCLIPEVSFQRSQWRCPEELQQHPMPSSQWVCGDWASAVCWCYNIPWLASASL